MGIDYKVLPSPCFVLEEERLIRNLELINGVQERACIEVILALKGFAMWRAFPLIKKYFKGATASSLNEALLCYEEFGSKAHTYAPAYLPDEFEQIMRFSSHITFNSINQYLLYKEKVHSRREKISCGIRVNPGYSDVGTDLYNPCAPGSRLGVAEDAFENGLPAGVEGLHFHALCESDSYSFERTLKVFEERFGHLIPQLKWVNMGGGHLMTKEGYDIEHLLSLLKAFKSKYDVKLVLEPGAAFVWRTGEIKATVLDIFESKGIKTAVLDVSFTAHMPDTLEMPYRPTIKGATDVEEGKPSYRLGGLSCLAGDFLGEYSFEKPLEVGDMVILEDMMHYTLVKTTMFNGVKHPDIVFWKQDGTFEIVRKYNYLDYKNRMA